MITSRSMPGPNVVELISLKSAEFALDGRGTLGGILFALWVRVHPKTMQPYCDHAQAWTHAALTRTRAFSRSEGFGDLDDESIAAMILEVLRRREERDRAGA